MSELLISIDLGTTRLKVAAFSLDGTLQHLIVRRHEDHRSPDGSRRWQVAESWWEDTVAGIRDLLGELPGRPVLGISLSGRGGAAVFADEQGEVIADPWSDNRHREQVGTLREWRAGGAHLSNSGLQLIAKYLWLKEQHPEATLQIARGYFAKDWLLHCLTGLHMTDWTSGPDAPLWDPGLRELDLPPTLLPEPALPWELAGSLTEEAALLLGLPRETPVAVGAHDGLAANIGAGAILSGDRAITLGTHAVVRAVQASHPEGSYRFYGFPPDAHIIGGNALLAGRSVDWFLDLMTPGEADDDRSSSYAVFEEAAGSTPAGSAGVRFLPFLAGQVAPEVRPGARALFAGLGLEHGRGALYRAVLEGSAFAIRNIFDQLNDWCGQPGLVRATGGGAESPLWMEILASTLNRSVELTGPAVEGRGACMCLAVALGIQGDLSSAVSAMVRVEETVRPDPTLADAYQSIFEDWSRLNEIHRTFDQPDI